MSISVFSPDRISMSQKERDVLKIMHAVLRRERTQAEAARLLDRSPRDFGNGNDAGKPIAVVAPDALASASWCRWMLRSATGWRDAASNWS